MRPLDISLLCPFVATAQQNDQRIAILPVVHAVAGAVVHAQFTNTFSNALPVAEQSGFQAIKPRNNTCARIAIPQCS